jgi:hypothetical protein
VGSVGREQAVDCRYFHSQRFIRKPFQAPAFAFPQQRNTEEQVDDVSVADRAQVNNLVEREARSP